ncbi:MAG: ABC transporter ATP-binding protein [Chloroflexi bacterium]|nr:ABC transporter ATP-binding protein [Chloroflexota bacterium]
MSNAYALQAKGLVKRFGSITAVDGLDLQVEPGVTYGLLGPNASGKTTLIRLLMGILPPTQGEATLLGKRVPDRALRTRVGYMPQAIALYEDLSVQENVTFYARLMGAYTAEGVAEVIGLVDLADRAKSIVAALSGGMKRRASLACALVHRPEVLFLDEPTVGVDPHLRVQFWEHFQRLNAQGVTIVVSTHIMDEAERCTRLGLLYQGRLIAEGTAKGLRERAGAETLEQAFLKFSGNGQA